MIFGPLHRHIAEAEKTKPLNAPGEAEKTHGARLLFQLSLAH